MEKEAIFVVGKDWSWSINGGNGSVLYYPQHACGFSYLTRRDEFIRSILTKSLIPVPKSIFRLDKEFPFTESTNVSIPEQLFDTIIREYLLSSICAGCERECFRILSCNVCSRDTCLGCTVCSLCHPRKRRCLVDLSSGKADPDFEEEEGEEEGE